MLIYSILFVIGGSIYSIIELTWDGDTHISMFVLGGLALILVGLLNEKWKPNIYTQMIIGSLTITTLELITGLLINQDYSIWDYRELPFNYKGQICILFSIVWLFLSYIAIKLDDWLRNKFKKE